METLDVLDQSALYLPHHHVGDRRGSLLTHEHVDDVQAHDYVRLFLCVFPGSCRCAKELLYRIAALGEGERTLLQALAAAVWARGSNALPLDELLQDEALHFIRIGTFLERADNTARLLDVKYHGLTETSLVQAANRDENSIDHHMDFYHWAAILRSSTRWCRCS